MKDSSRIASVTGEKQLYIMKLYIAGGEQHSRLARENLKSICEEYLKDRCQLEEIDVLADFASALKNKIFITPALLLESPEPRVMVVGNLSDREKVVSALRLVS